MLNKLFFLLSAAGLLAGTFYTALENRKLPFISEHGWDGFAGVVSAYTCDGAVSVTASSGVNAGYVIDGDEATFWQSEAPLPYHYVGRRDLNVFASGNGGLLKNRGDYFIAKTTDGNMDSGEKIGFGGGVSGVVGVGRAEAVFSFEVGRRIALIGVKCGVEGGGVVEVYARDSVGVERFVGRYDSGGRNYEWQNFFTPGLFCKGVRVVGTVPFMLFEVGALSELPREFVGVDLGRLRSVGQVWVRGDVPSAKVQVAVSSDGVCWEDVGPLTGLTGGRLTGIVLFLGNGERYVRYVRVYCVLVGVDWEKVALREVKVYDKYGPYGPPPVGVVGKYTLRESLGVNGIWGWGCGRYSDEKGGGGLEGLGLFSGVVFNARNYHEMNWDCVDPDRVPDYGAMANGEGTVAQPWLNWDREYVAWQKSGLRTLVSIKFSNATQPVFEWDNPYRAAYDYGRAFGGHFGVERGNGTVFGVDVGNEPWDYAPDFYRVVLQGMVDGINSVDSLMVVLPCALQAGFPSYEDGDFRNFAGVRLNAGIAKGIDGYNCHHYSYAPGVVDGVLRGVYPEHALSSFRALHNDIRFVSANMPGMPVYVTEWGWDSSGGGNEDCNFAECVVEGAQAVYGVRSALYMMRLGVAKFYWYFYANSNDYASLYSRSGLVGNREKGFLPKMSYRAFGALQRHLGDKRFLRVVAENEGVYAYLFGVDAGHATHLVVWVPEAFSADNIEGRYVVLPFGLPVKRAFFISGHTDSGEVAPLPVLSGHNSLRLKVGAVPVLLELDIH